MPKRVKFLREQKIGKEIVWIYSCDLVFNQKKITHLTITDHFQAGHSDVITKKLICGLVRRLHCKRMEPEPKKKPIDRDVFVRERMTYGGKKYRLIFWFKDGATNHLWVRNCHPQD
ncbi:MAG: hypothetical protein MRERV_16c020 [Mycoplasmataceae bacterium RV_VA103A]|nr:MAG: hypothetical protein MRERV_16c020 [Mycoplasmataceae bacterium RV_VA103A]